MSNILLILYKTRVIRPIILKIIASTPVKQSKSKVLREIFQKYHNIEVGYGTYGGCFNSSNINGNIKVGKYCSFAQNVYYFNANHPLDKITTHPIIYSPVFECINTETIIRKHLIIENDVWVGCNAIILSSCNRIGNGAVIGAGSVVTKDIPDYAIVAGVPAKIIGYRFEKEMIEHLNKLKWWDMSEDKIREIINRGGNVNDDLKVCE